MGLIEKWKGEGDRLRRLAESCVSPVGDDDEAAGLAMLECAADLESASTPRPPQVEWFGAPVDADGKPTKKWDSWMVLHSCYPSPHHWVLWRRVRVVDTVIFVGAGADYPADMRDILECIPVRREGPPAMDVTWDVVGG